MSSTGKVLVTGGGGFIGSHLVERLLREGREVRVLDNFATGHRANLAEVISEIELVEGDIQSYERVHNAVRGCELVFHIAALPSVPRSIQDPLTSTASNVTGTLNVLLAARDESVRRVVFASSSSVYGPQHEFPQREEAGARPISPYGVSKLAAEGYCRAFTRVYGLETVAVRYFNVFGPRQDPLSQYAAVIPKFITAVLNGERPLIFGDGEQSRDFTYIDNTVEGTLLASTAEGVAGETFNVACGEATTLNQLLEHISEISGRPVEAVYEKRQPGDLRRSQADIDFIWEIGVMPISFFLLAAVAVDGARGPGPPPRPLRGLRRREVGWWAGTVVASVAALIVIWLPYRGASDVRASERDVNQGRLDAALSGARSAADAQPYAATPRLQEALVLKRQGKLKEAAAAARQATLKESTNWRTLLILSRIEAERNRARASLADYRMARQLNPRSGVLIP